ncbi:hypothetical protein CA850_21605 [Micromonospora echinospora]|nr:hypothetical protein CA850_21605 [Micromonospora echinospora]
MAGYLPASFRAAPSVRPGSHRPRTRRGADGRPPSTAAHASPGGPRGPSGPGGGPGTLAPSVRAALKRLWRDVSGPQSGR